MESERFTECANKIVCAGVDDGTEVIDASFVKAGVITQEEYETFSYHLDNAPRTGHGACDHVMYIHMLRFLKGEEEPFFDVYRSVALSAAGILAWYSALDDGKQLDIPDFRNPEEREKVRGDYRMPFAKRYEDLTLPCRIDEDGE